MDVQAVTLYLDDGDVRLYHGHVLDVLRAMPASSVDCIITSPPYYGLRDYGTGRWEGGDATCDHVQRKPSPHSGLPDAGANSPEAMRTSLARLAENQAGVCYRDACGKCGARRRDDQIGLEASPAEYLDTLVSVFREARRVLADHGCVFVNLGDSYGRDPGKGGSGTPNGRNGRGEKYAGGGGVTLSPKNLLGMPWRLALALQDDGWILRSAITWCKRAPMPESVTDRPTTATEMVFMLTKKPRYWSDFEALKGSDGRNGSLLNYWVLGPEPFSEWGETVRRVPVDADAVGDDIERIASPSCPVHGDSDRRDSTACGGECEDAGWIRTRRNGAHPDQEPLLGLADVASTPSQDRSAGSSDSPTLACSSTATPHSTESHRTGVPSACDGTDAERTSDRTPYTSPSDASPAPSDSGNPGSSRTNGHTSRRCSCSYVRIVTEKTSHFATYPEELVRRCLLAGCPEYVCRECGRPRERLVERGELVGRQEGRSDNSVITLRNDAAVHSGRVGSRAVETLGWSDCGHNAYRRGVVLDPFIGSGTTARVARNHGRHAIGIDLNEEYLVIAARRLQQLGLLTEATL